MATRIGVFFDGTGNNMWNDVKIGDGSQSNVAKLYQLYKDSGYEVRYAEGVGTEAYTQGHTFTDAQIKDIRDNNVDRNSFYRTLGLAVGEGAKAIVDKKMAEIEAYILQHPGEEIIVDVYGFSRGATEARDFINEFNAKYADLNGSAIGFVGLFDTVASIGMANSINIGYNLDLNENSADRIVHIIADDETRGNFPLESLYNGGWGLQSNMNEISNMGVHSDIGGGYGVLDMNKKIVIDSYYHVYTNGREEGDAKLASLNDYVNSLNASAGKIKYRLESDYDSLPATGDWTLSAIIIEEKEFGFGLSNVSLNDMYNSIRQAGIALAPVSTLGATMYKNQSYSNYAIPQNIDQSYVHISSSNTWYGQSASDWIANHQTSSGIRVVYPNDPANSEDKLLLLSAEDKTILHYLSSDYTIIGTEKQFDDITENIVQNAPEFMTHRLEYITQLLSDNPDQSGTLYQDHYLGKSFYGQKINGIALVDFAASGDNILVYDDNNEGQIVYAKEGEDLVYTGGGNDVLDGGAGNDILLGGEGFDTYYSSDGDTIDDSDGKGEVYFEGFQLTGGTLTGIYGNTKTYEGDGGIYVLRSDNTLIFSKEGNFVTINNFDKKANDLGIELTGDDLELSIFAPIVSENIENGVATGAITLSHAYGEDVIVTMYTQDDSAIAGEDYVARPTFDVRIPAGVTYAEFDISILDDKKPESTETFYALVESVRTTSGESVDFILVDVQPFVIEDDDSDEENNNNDDGYVHVKVSDGSRIEDNTVMRFDITLSKALEQDITIDLATMDGSATSGSDYMGSQGSVTIRAGSTSAYYTAMIFEDSEIEGNETFTLTPTGHNYSGSEKVLLDNNATGTIIDDDIPVEVTFSSAQASELSGAIHFTVSISKVLESDLDIDFDTFDGTAIGGSDYAGLSGTVTIAAGSRTAEITIPLINDKIPEDLEYFMIAPTGSLYHGQDSINVFFNNAGTGTIIDDDDPEYILIHISDAAAGENAESMTFNVTLTKPLDKDITIHTSQGSTTITAGGTSGSVSMTWSDDCVIEPDSTFSVYPTGYDYNGTLKVLFANDATGTIYDDDHSGPCGDSCNNGHAPCDPPPPPRRDPLVLDLNQDGEISTVSLADSSAYFDITGDGIKERVGWVQASEGIVVMDKNGNGKIDCISEVFGTATTSGFYELRQLADSNYDGVIDRRDELYNQLKVWQDTNQDGISQASELKTLAEAGVKNIQLDVIGTNINLNGNLLSEAGRYFKSNSTQRKAA
ncbi:Calx-beta domain-containing protein [Sulfuricurvum sp. RIFCSPLOWO2_12_FULL_43_24]|uniref:Calx-beta domain-containing protein n=1 Tax=Sulfuricurvum sp. RIFCSPLOWO2_12_FULL_43_24 TaxID=1802247 RepID=UPI0008AD36EA|nr:Calx-beta domain-containing protein [Sulfuricurvum sp. RIFCSPLOWO2_12_FULL_43_24]OHD88679.1 MAG: hypothetical protein A3G19_03595 [Sulfuricurvum sp. RIFCSPLOWO2_12_FULL_43_24]